MIVSLPLQGYYTTILMFHQAFLMPQCFLCSTALKVTLKTQEAHSAATFPFMCKEKPVTTCITLVMLLTSYLPVQFKVLVLMDKPLYGLDPASLHLNPSVSSEYLPRRIPSVLTY